jgi:hypothetical protein
MAGRPSIRANWSKHALRFVRRLPPTQRDAILREIGSDTLEQIGFAGILSWLPAEHHARIFDAVRNVLAQPGAIALWRDVMTANLDQPLLRPLVQGGLRLFGATPSSVIRMSPRAWSLVARDCGTHLVSRGEGRIEVRLAFVDTPPMLATPGFVAHCLGNCEAVLRFLDLQGKSVVVDNRLDAGRFTIELSDIRAEAAAAPRTEEQSRT